MFNEKRNDRKLNINTRGIIDWPLGVNLEYFRAESTLYRDLKRFKKYYIFLPNSKLVDFGSGKGRIIYYFNNHLKISTVGIEYNDLAFQHLSSNFQSYAKKYSTLSKKITIYKMKAENYKIKTDENIFYFFNPFTFNLNNSHFF